jgi:hypothetical protein
MRSEATSNGLELRAYPYSVSDVVVFGATLAAA